MRIVKLLLFAQSLSTCHHKSRANQVGWGASDKGDNEERVNEAQDEDRNEMGRATLGQTHHHGAWRDSGLELGPVG
ncbi:hypothetical protein ACOMHN_024791 [Nucella lapillus]